MNWIGLARSLQPQITATVGILLAILLLWFALRWLVDRGMTGDGRVRARAWVNRGAQLALAGLLVAAAWQVAAVLGVNRVPRQDVDRSAVYEQMDSKFKK